MIVDKEYSSIKFEASKMLFVDVNGEFTNFSGTINVENNKLTNINGLVSIGSINTNDDERDDYLKADDYFFISKFPNTNIIIIILFFIIYFLLL
jgi:polyisoprenoid-binding protein YceI